MPSARPPAEVDALTHALPPVLDRILWNEHVVCSGGQTSHKRKPLVTEQRQRQRNIASKCEMSSILIVSSSSFQVGCLPHNGVP